MSGCNSGESRVGEIGSTGLSQLSRLSSSRSELTRGH